MKLIGKSAVATTLTTCLVFLSPAAAEWSPDPTVRTPVVTAEYVKEFRKLV